MATETAAELRAQVTHARHLADNMFNEQAQLELRQIADRMESDADKLDRTVALAPMQSPISGL